MIRYDYYHCEYYHDIHYSYSPFSPMAKKTSSERDTFHLTVTGVYSFHGTAGRAMERHVPVPGFPSPGPSWTRKSELRCGQCSVHPA